MSLYGHRTKRKQVYLASRSQYQEEHVLCLKFEVRFVAVVSFAFADLLGNIKWLIACIEPVLWVFQQPVFPISTLMAKPQEFGSITSEDINSELDHTRNFSAIYFAITKSNECWTLHAAQGNFIETLILTDEFIDHARSCEITVDSIMLLENGFSVTSVDASDKMLKHALRIRWSRRKEEAFDNWVIEEGNWLALSEADIQVPDGGFDAIICLGNSFAHLPDFSGDLSSQRLALTNFKDYLKPGGCLFIDHRNYDSIIDTGKAPQRNVYYNSECIEDIKTSLLYVDGKATMLTLDYTIDPTKATEDFKEDGDTDSKKKKGEVSKFRLSYCPHRLSGFTSLLEDVFGKNAAHTVYGDLKPLGEVKTPAYYVHFIQKPETDIGGEQ